MLHAKKLYRKGFRWARPVWAGYKILPVGDEKSSATGYCMSQSSSSPVWGSPFFLVV